MYKLDITDRARDDSDAAYAWMAENVSPAFAEKWYQGLLKQFETLAKHPSHYPVAHDSRKFPERIQEVIYGKASHKHKYRILFTIREDVVAILFIYHSSRKDLEP